MAPGVGSIPKVVVLDPIRDDAWPYEEEAAILADAGASLVIPADQNEAEALLPSADILVATGELVVDRARVASLGRCVGILCYSVGTDHVDHAAAARASIPVRNLPAYCTDEVSDHALALLLAAERRLLPLAEATRDGWANSPSLTELGVIRRLRGRTLGILGAGRIGRLVAAKARTFGYRTIAYDPHTSVDERGDLDLVPDLRHLLEEADALVLCAALTDESRNIIGPTAFEYVKRGLVLVNVARGGLIDEAALADALQRGTVGYAALDVRADEPPSSTDDVLADAPNLLQTPHSAASSQESFADLRRMAAASAIDMLIAAGRLPPHGPADRSASR